MSKLIDNLFSRYRSEISYLFFGVCTTFVNIAAYYICARLFGLSTVISTFISWLIAVVFAFITNKICVFESKSWSGDILFREALSFFVCRLSTGILDLVIMLVSVDMMGANDMLMKIISNVLVIILNYVASKFLIFNSSEK